MDKKTIARSFVVALREGRAVREAAEFAAERNEIPLISAIDAIKAVHREGVLDMFTSKSKKQPQVPKDKVAAVLKRTTLTQDAKNAEKEWRGKNVGHLFDPK